MLSKSGKVEWLCPNCQSSKITPLNMLGQNSGECFDCRTWWPWCSRLKISVAKRLKQKRGKND